MTYRPAPFGPNLMTIFGPLLRPPPRVPLRRERWELADGDFVDVDRMAGPPGSPLFVALHGLEGSSSAHYIRGLLREAQRAGWRGLALNFRGCSGDMNRLIRSYHSGETGDLDELIRRVRTEADRIVIAGCSLGGNVLVKWLGERETPPEVKAAAALSVPFDLAACARTLDSGGFWRWVYRSRFLRTLKRKSLLKQEKFPAALDSERVRNAATLFEFDGAVTAAVHGFKDAPDYYAQSSSARFVQNVRIPLLLLSAADDPFIPAETIPRDVPRNVTLEVHEKGGHLGFVDRRLGFYAERRTIDFLRSQLESAR